MTCREAQEYILAIPKFAGKRPLSDTERLLGRILCGDAEETACICGDTEETANISGDAEGNGEPCTCRLPKSKVIHIAGTNGKGSVCAYLRSILMESGRSVGMFTSPHLEDMRERISLSSKSSPCEMIPEEDFVFFFEKIKGYAEEEEQSGRPHPSFFEFLFLMAMAYFKEKEPDYIILETGMGGRLDATSAAEPDLCIITEIGYDHMEYLGDTLEEIAAEKAAIIRPGVPVVFVERRRESTEVLTECAKKSKSPATVIGKDSILNVNINNKSIDFSLDTGYYKYVNLFLNTTALYQTENASLAVAATEFLPDGEITEGAVRKGLWEAKWPGRMEEILPGIYLDGAHNEDGMEAFLATVGEDSCEGKRFLLFGASKDKRYDRMIRMAAESGLFQKAAVAALKTERSASLKELKAAWGGHEEISCRFFESAKEAYLYLLGERKSGDKIYIAGSLYLAGEMKSLIRR